MAGTKQPGSETRPPLVRRDPGFWAFLGVVAALLLAYWVMAVSATTGKSNTFDEIAHLPAGYTYWTTNDFRLNPENGNLPQRLGALPLLWLDVRFPAGEKEAWAKSDVWTLGHRFFFESGNDLDQMLIWARGTMALLGVGVGVAVLIWSWRLYGRAGAVLSLVLLVFSPGFLAHGPLVASDVAASLLFLLAIAAVWLLLHRVDWARVLFTGVAVGALSLAKFSAPLIVPMAAILVGIRLLRSEALPVAAFGWRADLRRRGTQLAVLAQAFAVAAVIAWIVLWSAYGFRYAAFARPDPQATLASGGSVAGWGWVQQAQDERHSNVVDMVLFARDHGLFPEAYLYGFSHSYIKAQARSAFLNGAYSIEGWPWFFPYAFLVKTPLPTLALCIAAGAVAVLAWRRRGSPPQPRLVAVARSFYRTAPLWVLIVVYGYISITSHLNIGHRHLLPIYPALFILAGAAGPWLASWRKPAAWVVAALVAWLAAESLYVRPHYLAYFNELVGGPRNGYKHLVDSSLDWGQDLPGLRDWLDEQGLDGQSQTPVYLSYFGTGLPSYYQIRATLLPGYMPTPAAWPIAPLRGGVYCVSATMLQGVYMPYAVGPVWAPRYERNYRELTRLFQQLDQTQGDPAARQQLLRERGEEFWAQAMGAYQAYRAARLFAHLRERRPDDHVGYSILIYRLSDEDVRRALAPDLPPPETRQAPWVGH